MKIHLDKVNNFAGFATENAGSEGLVKILARASLTSDDPLFYKYSEQISSVFLNKNRVQPDDVSNFLIVIKSDLSANIYINNFPVQLGIHPKRDIKLGEYVMLSDIADITSVHFPEAEIIDSDRVIYCFKVGWRFGLFFDLTAASMSDSRKATLDITAMQESIGALRRYLYFYHVYKTMESQNEFDQMIKDGWFPFIEIIAIEFKTLAEAYKSQFDIENKALEVLRLFDSVRIERIITKWWNNKIFAAKRPILEAGVSGFTQDNQPGFINCIKTLSGEVEGILRHIYLAETGRGNNVKIPDLLGHIISKVANIGKKGHSLFLPEYFLQYLANIIFANFDTEKGDVPFSRHSTSHGVAATTDYTKARALQLILILDQIYFYLTARNNNSHSHFG